MAKPSVTTTHVQLDIPPVRALFEGSTDAWIIGLSSTERPPRGLAGLLDWHLHGWISRSIESGFLSGSAGECAYLPTPLSTPEGFRTLHLLFIGMGPSGRERSMPEVSQQALEKNLKSLGRKAWGASLSDLGDLPGQDAIKKISRALAAQSEEATLWISP
jgi:hypothetical protein